MAKVDVDLVAQKAKALGFSHRVLGSGRHQLLFKSRSGSLTGTGYQGNLDGCFAYLSGWADRESTAAT